MTFANKCISGRRMERFELVYKIKAEIAGNGDRNELLKNSIDIILTEIQASCTSDLPSEAFEYQDFVLHNEMVKAACISIPQRYLWSLRFRCRSSAECPEEPPCWRSYDVAIVENSGRLMFGLQVKAEASSYFFPRFSPRLITKLAAKDGLCQCIPLSGKPMVISDMPGIDELCDLLQSPERTLPVIVISETNYRQWYFSEKPVSYLVNPVSLARQLHGYAHVIQLSFQAALAWTRQVGNTWAVFDGAIRIFMPRFDFRTSMPGEHAIFFKDRIWSYQGNSQNGPEAFSANFVDMIRKLNTDIFIDWYDVYFFPEARLLQTEIKKLTETSSTPVSLYQQELINKVDSLELQLRNAQKRNEVLEDIVAVKNTELAACQNQVANLQLTIDALSGFPQKTKDEDLPLDEIPLSSGYNEMSTWAEIYLPNKLILLPRAVHSLDKAQYRSPELVYKALLLLAFEYRNSRMGISDDKPFKAKCQELGLELRGAVTQSNASENYYVNYPIGSSNQALLKFQIQKGVSRQKRYCLRIYFFWDENAKLVVVGDLPAHLNTRIS